MNELTFGVFDWLDDDGRSTPAELYADRLALARRADTGAFTTYHLAEHHGTPLGLAPSPGMFMAAVAAVTARIRLAPTTFVIPLYDPMRLAEEIGMLDQLCGGRLDLGVGKGSSPIEAAMFGHDQDEMERRYDAFLPSIIHALESGFFVWPDGFGPEGAAPIELYSRGAQQPHPPLWYPTSNPESIAVAAAQGQHTVFGFGFFSPPDAVVAEHSRMFFARHDGVEGTAYAGARFGLLRHVVVADTDAEALWLARGAFEQHFATFSHLWDKAGAERFTRRPDVEGLLADGKILAGSPATVAERLARLVDACEVNHVALALAWGSLSGPAALHSLELFDTAVVPAVRAAVTRVPYGPV